MDVRNCKMCGAIYNYIGGQYRNLCPQCVKKMEDKFMDVKQYIEDNPGAGIGEVSKQCEVRPEQIERWIREERLYFSEDSQVGIPCEGCGTTIKTGRFCDKCRNELGNELSNMYSKPKGVQMKKPKDSSAKMRFLE